jgi:hypothetical protein
MINALALTCQPQARLSGQARPLAKPWSFV